MSHRRSTYLVRTIIGLALVVASGGFFLEFVLPVHPAAAANELFFSEYIEGSGNNKALEIYNPTGQTIDLSAEGYDVQFFFNGHPDPDATIPLTGMVTPGNVYVLADDGADPAILAQADQLYTGSFFNGDDAIVLRRAGVILDVIGVIGEDPGSAWGSGDASTKDHTLRRKPPVQTGDANGADPFDPSLEWDEFPQNSFDNLGIHTIDVPTVTPTPTETPSSAGTLTPTSTPTATPSPGTGKPVPGDVLINEVVTDPQQDWSGGNFSVPPGSGVISEVDEFVELYIRTGGLDLTGWTIELRDGSDVIGDLTPAGAFQTTRYVGAGGFTHTAAGDYLVLGNVAGSGAMNNDILIVLKDSLGTVIDRVEIGSDPAGDGPANGAPDGSARGGDATDTTDEAVCRVPNGADTDDNVADFTVCVASPGAPNPSVAPTPTPALSPTATPTPFPAPTLPPKLLISEVLYDGLTSSSEGDEFVEICNPNPAAVNLTGYKVGDEETYGGGEGMYYLPAGYILPVNGCIVIARDAAQFQERFGFAPDASLSDLPRDTDWGRGVWSLSNSGDEVIVLAPDNTLLDSVAFRNGDYAAVGLSPDATAPQPDSLQRVWPGDVDSMPDDFVRAAPNPGLTTLPPPSPDPPPPPADLPNGMHAYWGHLHAHTTYSDGAGPPGYALAVARASGLHFYALTDHGWWLTDSEWNNLLTQTVQATDPGQFVALRGVEWSHETAGHLNIFNSTVLPRRDDPRFDTLAEMYDWLAANPTVVAQFNHPDRAYDGNFDEFALDAPAASSIVLQEIGNHAQGYVTYETAFVQSNAVGWRVAPTNNGDTHTSDWGADTIGRTGIVAPALTQTDLLDALRARRVFSTEDANLALALRRGSDWMGATLDVTGPVSLTVDFVDADAEPLTLTLFDGSLPLATASFADVAGHWTVAVDALPGHFFWVRAVQSDGDRAWSAPLWIAGQLEPEAVQISELLPAPGDWDWNGDGTTDQHDEWLELYNPLDRPVGLGGWRLVDASGASYQLPVGTVISSTGYLMLPHDQTGLSLNNSGDSLSLIHPNGVVVDTFVYTGSPGYDESWCRLPDGRWSEDCAPSPGEPNWEKPPAAPLTVNIFQAKRLAYNAWIRVKGQVTAPPGVFGSRIMYIQDNSSGIRVYLPTDHRLSFSLGDRVEVVGDLRAYHGESEIVVDDAADVEFLEPGDPLPPLPIATTTMLEPYEGVLVMLQGQAVRFKGRTIFWVDDGTDPAKVYISGATGIRKPFIESGSVVTVVGIVGQYTSGDAPTRDDYRLLPRYQSDLRLPDSPVAPAGWPTLLPETGY